MKHLRSRLTYANVMATLAMLVALGGTGYAAATIGSKQIINNSVKSIDVKNNTLGLADFAASTRSSLRPRWALVDADGTVIAQSGGVTVTAVGSGDYYVDMGVNLTGRAISATKAWTAGDPGADATLETGLCGGGTQGIACAVNDFNDTVYVGTADASTGAGSNNPFYVAAL